MCSIRRADLRFNRRLRRRQRYLINILNYCMYISWKNSSKTIQVLPRDATTQLVRLLVKVSYSILCLFYRQSWLRAFIRLRYRGLFLESGIEHPGRRLHSNPVHPCCYLADIRHIWQGSGEIRMECRGSRWGGAFSSMY